MKASLYAVLCLVCLGFAPRALAEEAEPDERLIRCIAHIVYGEARDEPVDGQFVVAWSIIYRAAADLPEFGGSDYCSVAYKRTASHWEYDGAKAAVTDMRAWEASVSVAYWALMGYGRPDQPVMYFCAVNISGACRWHDRATELVGQIGGHRFYVDRRFPVTQASAQAGD